VNDAPQKSLNTPAWQVLLAACNANPSADRINSALAAHIDWEIVLKLADRHGVSSLLYQNLARVNDAVPIQVNDSLRKSYEQNLHKSLFLTRELFRVLDYLDGLSASALPYKGIVLSEIYYGDIALRRAGDMDLFVRAHDVARIKNAMRELGYISRVAIPAHAEGEYIASGYEATFDSPAGKNLLELQWALQPRFYAVDFDMEGLFERSVEVTVVGRRLRTPSSEDLLLVLSLHAAKHVWERLIWLCDIAQVVKQELDWEWIRAQAHKLGIERILCMTLLLANRLLGAVIPAAIEGAILRDSAAKEFAERMAVSIEDGIEYEEQKVSYFRLMMQLRERRWDRARFLTRLAFTPGPGEWEAIRLPRALLPFYRVVRMVRLARRLVR
jgi:hypothetical protein